MAEVQLGMVFDGMPGNDEHTLEKARRGLRLWQTRNKRQLASINAQRAMDAEMKERDKKRGKK